MSGSGEESGSGEKTGWTREFNKDYHFITVSETTTKNYGHVLEISCSGEFDVYMLMKSISQSKACYLVSGALNVGMTYWVKASVALELTTLSVGISTFSKATKGTASEAIGVKIPVKILEEADKIAHAMVHALHTRTGAVRINTSATQATV